MQCVKYEKYTVKIIPKREAFMYIFYSVEANLFDFCTSDILLAYFVRIWLCKKLGYYPKSNSPIPRTDFK